jgi:hypothetical protein
MGIHACAPKGTDYPEVPTLAKVILPDSAQRMDHGQP